MTLLKEKADRDAKAVAVEVRQKLRAGCQPLPTWELLTRRFEEMKESTQDLMARLSC